MRHRFIFLLVLTLLSACKHPNQKLAEDAPFISENFKDDRGKTVSLAQPPQRIVSLAPSVTEMLFAIGAGPRVVARSHVCNWPPYVEDLPSIRTFPQLSQEQVFSFKPDLIVGTTDLQKDEQVAVFEDKGIPVMLHTYKTIPDVYRHIRLLGKMLKLEKEANTLADSLHKAEERLKAATSNQIKYGTMVLVSVDPLIVAGGHGYLNEMITAAGGKNIFGNLTEPFAEVSEEAIIEGKPEFVVLASRDDKMYNQLIEKYPDLHTQMPAALSNQVFRVDPNLLVRPGPRIVEGIAELIAVLHPRLNPTFLLEGEIDDSTDEQP